MRRIFFVLAILAILLSFVTPVAAGAPLPVYYAGPQDQIRQIIKQAGNREAVPVSEFVMSRIQRLSAVYYAGPG